jgi:pimeloyl-ACP methyl ester carboxylesterase
MNYFQLSSNKALKPAIRLMLILFPFSFSFQMHAQSQFIGFWNGITELQGMPMRAVFEISSLKPGSEFGVFKSPDQNDGELSISDIRIKSDSIFIDVASIKVRFEGLFIPNTGKIAGKIVQSGQDYPITLQRELIESAVYRPQEPQAPFPYYFENVRFENKKAGIQLAGTLTLPAKKGSFPMVVLISGSGPQDRNEEIFEHKPFLVLADYLAKNGIGCLRYDDRGVGESEGDFAAATSYDFASDVEAAVAYLQSRRTSGVIGLMGHSEGGIIAPMVGAENPDIAFIVSLAGIGVPIDQILYQQSIDIAMAEGVDRASAEVEAGRSAELIAILKAESNSAIALEKCSLKFDDLFESYKSLLPNYEEFKNAQLSSMATPWMHVLLNLDPGTYWSRVKCPVLAINGSKDVQVNMDQNLRAIEQFLIAGNNEDFTISPLKDHNHLFQRCSTGAVSEYGKIEMTVSPTALDLIVEWIRPRFAVKD